MMLENGLFALERMPNHALPVMVLITDGVAAVPSTYCSYGGLLSCLVRSDVKLNVLQVVGAIDHLPFGFVPHGEKLRFLTSFTNGAYSEDSPLCHLEGDENLFFAVHMPLSCKEDILDFHFTDVEDKETVQQYVLRVGIVQLITCRMWEGFKHGAILDKELKGGSMYRTRIMLTREMDNCVLQYSFTFDCPESVGLSELRSEKVSVSIAIAGTRSFLDSLLKVSNSKQAASSETLSSVQRGNCFRVWQFLEEIQRTDVVLNFLDSVRLADYDGSKCRRTQSRQKRAAADSIWSMFGAYSTEVWRRWLTVKTLDVLCTLHKATLQGIKHRNDLVNRNSIYVVEPTPGQDHVDVAPARSVSENG